MSPQPQPQGMPSRDKAASMPTTASWLRRLSGRLLKLGMALALVGVAARAITSEQGYIGTDNAVVSAQITRLRVPIEGYVRAAGGIAAGQPIALDAVIEHVENKGDESGVAELATDLRRITRQRNAALEQRAALDGLVRVLTARAGAGNAAQTTRLSANIGSTEKKVTAAETRRDELRREYERKLTLSRSGDTAQADVDRVRADYAAAAQEVGSIIASMEAETAARDAARSGILSEAGSNDVNYSTQRVDEISILLTHVNRSIADLTASAEEVEGKIRILQNREQAHRDAQIVAPIAGMIWKVGASNGERVGPGDTAVELVDCSSAFVIASVPQYRMGEIEPGGEARFKFVGEQVERVARVTSIDSSALTRQAERLASVPLPEKEPTAVVTLSSLSLPSTAHDCPIGRTARVLLPLKHQGLVQGLARRLGLDRLLRRLAT